MSQTHTEILHMRISPGEMRLLDDVRKTEADLPSRSEMVRRLIRATHAERGLRTGTASKREEGATEQDGCGNMSQ